MFSGGIERNQWHEIGQQYFPRGSTFYMRLGSNELRDALNQSYFTKYCSFQKFVSSYKHTIKHHILEKT